MNRDAELIWEAYKEEVLDEGIKDMARNALMGGMMAATMAGAVPRNASAQEVAPPIQQVEYGNVKSSLDTASDIANTLTKNQQNKNENFYRLLRGQDDNLGKISPFSIRQDFKVEGEREVAKLFDIINYLAKHTDGSSSDIEYVKSKVADSNLGKWREEQGKLNSLQDSAVYVYKQLVNRYHNQ